MDRIDTYREIIKRVIHEVAEYAPTEEGIRKEIILDDANGHYQRMPV